MKLKDPTLTTHSRLCSAHFTADCYETDLKAKLLGTKLKVCLKEDAVPTIFDFSGYSHTKTDITSASHSDSMQSNLREERLKRRSLKKDIGQVY